MDSNIVTTYFHDAYFVGTGYKPIPKRYGQGCKPSPAESKLCRLARNNH
jgi:hypothetical protein